MHGYGGEYGIVRKKEKGTVVFCDGKEHAWVSGCYNGWDLADGDLVEGWFDHYRFFMVERIVRIQSGQKCDISLKTRMKWRVARVLGFMKNKRASA